MKPITHLVFAGNALRSLCLCGVLRYIYCYDLNNLIRDVSGTSMGAFFALAFALKIPIEQLEKYIYELCSKSELTKIYTSSFINIFNDYGVGCSLDYLKLFRGYIKEKFNQDDLTFLELSKKTGINLYVSATNISNGNNVNFNVNNTPNISVIEAVSASMCIPIFSKPIIIEGEYYIDGYLTDNFPIDVFDDINKDHILGVALNIDKEYEISNHNKKGELTFSNYLYNIMYLMYINTYKLCYYNKIKSYKDVLILKNSPIRSIFSLKINDDDNYIDLSLTEDEINNLFLQGFKETNDYMNRYNYSNSNLDLTLSDKSSDFQEI